MEHSQKNLLSFIISILIHLVLLLLLFIWYHAPSHENSFTFDPSQTSLVETIFDEPTLPSAPATSIPEEPAQPLPIPPPTPILDEWAESKPRAGTHAESLDTMNEEETIQDAQQSEEQQEAPSDFAKASSDKPEPLSRRMEQETHAAASDMMPLADSGTLAISSNRTGDASDAPGAAGLSPTAQKQHQARKVLAGITKGYLNQLQHEGTSLVKTIGGNPNALPTAQQLQYERYFAKLQWCLENAHSINRDRCRMREPIQTTMRIAFKLNRVGKMSDFAILQSSGHPIADDYIRFLFDYASKSFPPLPPFIPEPFMANYVVMIAWNVESPYSMGFNRYE